MVRIKSAIPKENYFLFVSFTDGKEGFFDVKPYFASGSLFKEITKPSVFQAVKVSNGTIEWPNGVDLCPDCVYIKTISPLDAPTTK